MDQLACPKVIMGSETEEYVPKQTSPPGRHTRDSSHRQPRCQSGRNRQKDIRKGGKAARLPRVESLWFGWSFRGRDRGSAGDGGRGVAIQARQFQAHERIECEEGKRRQLLLSVLAVVRWCQALALMCVLQGVQAVAML